MRRLATLFLLVPALATPSAAQAFAAPALDCSKTLRVTVGDKGDRLFFSKDALTIGRGACVRWTWTGVRAHRVVTPDGLHSSRSRAPHTFRRRFSRPRFEPYRIYCSVHPRRMKMTVRVLNRRPLP